MRPGGRGFTLMEMLVALGMFAALAASLGRSLGTGIDAWRRGRRAADMQQEARVILEDLARELRNGVPVRGGWAGDEASLSFFTARGGGLLKMSYRRAEAGAIEKEVSVNGMPAEAERRLLTAAPADVRFAYAYAPDAPGAAPRWEARWEGDDMPAGVRVRLSLTDPASGETLTLEKTAGLPAGLLKGWKE